VGCDTVSTGQWFIMLQRATLQGQNVDVKEGEVAICLSLECSGYSRDILVVHSEERERQPSFLPQHWHFDPEEVGTIVRWNIGKYSPNYTASHPW
jgi:hypothetical protein